MLGSCTAAPIKIAPTMSDTKRMRWLLRPFSTVGITTTGFCRPNLQLLPEAKSQSIWPSLVHEHMRRAPPPPANTGWTSSDRRPS
eukprot:scaffold24107_cov140-Isochrysis_galbana.AAC.2